MPEFTLTALVPWVITHGYFILFFATLVEGPLVTIAAGVASGLGYYNIVIIILIAIAGDLTADIIYYLIGYHSRSLIIERFGHYIGITKERMEKVGGMVHEHFGKTMLAVKLSPFIAIPGLIAVAASHPSLKKYIKISLLITTPKSILLALLGFYSGQAYIYLADTITDGLYAAGALTLVIVVIYVAYRKIFSRVAKNFA